MKFSIQALLTITWFIVSCGSQSTSTQDEDTAVEMAINSVNDTNLGNEISLVEVENLSPPEGNIVEIKFDEFSVEIDSLYIWQEEEFATTQQDTAEVFLELGEEIEGQTLKINQFNKGNLRVYQRFENSVTIMAEGPHCDLTEWLHYDSEWQELPISKGEFLTESYTMEERQLFHEITMEELREIVRERCGDGWAAQIKDVNSPTEFPSGVGTSRIFLRFVLEGNGKPVEKVISFIIPMGC